MLEHIIIAGAGGQGIMLLGRVLATAGLIRGFEVTWFPSYGAEVRGGTANCMVILSNQDISSPYIRKANSLIIMNKPSLLKFKNRIEDGGFLLLNSSLARSRGCKQNSNSICLPFTELAIKLGNVKVANMIALGAYVAKRNILSRENVIEAIEEVAPPEKKNLIEINKQAISEGIKLII